jgi:hypothetical protein
MARRDQIISELEKMSQAERDQALLHSMNTAPITGQELLDTLRGQKSFGVDNPGLIPRDERLTKLRRVF